MTIPPDHRWRVLIHTIDGRQLYWHRDGAIHTLAPELGQVWVTNFKPSIFQVLPDGGLVPRGSDVRAVDIASVSVEPASQTEPL